MAPDAVRWNVPDDVREMNFRRIKRLMWNQAIRLVTFGMAFLAVLSPVLYRVVPAERVGGVIAIFGGLFSVFLLMPLAARRQKGREERAVDAEGFHRPGCHLIRWRHFRGYDLDTWPHDAGYRRLRLLRTTMGVSPLDLVLPSDPATSEQIVERVARHLPRAFPGIRDRGPVEGWPLAIGLACALAYGVAAGWLAGPYAGEAAEYVRHLPQVVGACAPVLAWLAVGPGWPWALLARRFRPQRLTRHYVFMAVVLNMRGNMVLLMTAAVRSLGQ
jgi:hypothetical protein